MIDLFYIFLSSIFLFLLGFISIILHRNILFILISLEIMINSVSLMLIFIGHYWSHIDGQIIYTLSVTLSAIEAGISLMLLIKFYKKQNSLNFD